MDGQMTIFDFLPPPEDDLETLDEEVMVARIAERTGLIFKKNTGTKLDHNLYEAKYKKAIIDVTYSRYDTIDELNGKRFIGVGYSFSKGGGGSPCDSLAKAVDRIKGYQQTIDDMDKPKVKRSCENCNRYRMTVDATTCEPRYMICHRPGTVYGDQITNPESYVCECWEERGKE